MKIATGLSARGELKYLQSRPENRVADDCIWHYSNQMQTNAGQSNRSPTKYRLSRAGAKGIGSSHVQVTLENTLPLKKGALDKSSIVVGRKARRNALVHVISPATASEIRRTLGISNSQVQHVREALAAAGVKV